MPPPDLLTGGVPGLGGPLRPVPLGGADPVPDGMLGAHTVAGFSGGVVGSVVGGAGSVVVVAASAGVPVAGVVVGAVVVGAVVGVAGPVGPVGSVDGAVVEGIAATVGAGLAGGRRRPRSGTDTSVTPGAGGEGNG